MVSGKWCVRRVQNRLRSGQTYHLPPTTYTPRTKQLARCSCHRPAVRSGHDLSCLRRRYVGTALQGVRRRGSDPVPDQLLDGGLRVRSAYLHRGPARLLVHNLKYRGIEACRPHPGRGDGRTDPSFGSTSIPIPRVTGGKLRHGIDPGRGPGGQVGPSDRRPPV